MSSEKEIQADVDVTIMNSHNIPTSKTFKAFLKVLYQHYQPKESEKLVITQKALDKEDKEQQMQLKFFFFKLKFVNEQFPLNL